MTLLDVRGVPNPRWPVLPLGRLVHPPRGPLQREGIHSGNSGWPPVPTPPPSPSPPYSPPGAFRCRSEADCTLNGVCGPSIDPATNSTCNYDSGWFGLEGALRRGSLRPRTSCSVSSTPSFTTARAGRRGTTTLFHTPPSTAAGWHFPRMASTGIVSAGAHGIVPRLDPYPHPHTTSPRRASHLTLHPSQPPCDVFRGVLLGCSTTFYSDTPSPFDVAGGRWNNGQGH